MMRVASRRKAAMHGLILMVRLHSDEG